MSSRTLHLYLLHTAQLLNVLVALWADREAHQVSKTTSFSFILQGSDLVSVNDYGIVYIATGVENI